MILTYPLPLSELLVQVIVALETALSDACSTYLALSGLDEVEPLGYLTLLEYELAEGVAPRDHVARDWHQVRRVDVPEQGYRLEERDLRIQLV